MQLEADCSRCAALCCVVPAFARSSDFAVDKPAGTPCVHLAADHRCGIHAERVDEPQSNERITDRILESIRKAEYVIVDLTGSRPNVFYEAGYAHGLRKIPIYVALKGTALQFDLKDYPVIFFDSMRELKEGLEARLRGLAENESKGAKR